MSRYFSHGREISALPTLISGRFALFKRLILAFLAQRIYMPLRHVYFYRLSCCQVRATAFTTHVMQVRSERIYSRLPFL